jgi:hypothetical protein
MTLEDAIKESLVKWRAIVERTERGVYISPYRDEHGLEVEPYTRCAMCEWMGNDCNNRCPLFKKRPEGDCGWFYQYVNAYYDKRKQRALTAARTIVALLEAAQKEGK